MLHNEVQNAKCKVQNEGVGFADLLELFQKEIPKLSTLNYPLSTINSWFLLCGRTKAQCGLHGIQPGSTCQIGIGLCYPLAESIVSVGVVRSAAVIILLQSPCAVKKKPPRRNDLGGVTKLS
jgi:C4-dicarboxylate transporter